MIRFNYFSGETEKRPVRRNDPEVGGREEKKRRNIVQHDAKGNSRTDEKW